MKHNVQLIDASDIYDCAANGILEVQTVRHEGFDTFSTLLLKLNKQLSEQNLREDWAFLTTPLKRYEWLHTQTPLNFNFSPEGLIPDLRDVEKQISSLRFSYPNEEKISCALLDAFRSLIQLREQPALASIRSLVSQYRRDNFALVLQSRKLITITEQFLKRYVGPLGLKIVTPSDLIQHSPFDRMIALGNPRMLAEHIYKAQNARTIHWIQWERYAEPLKNSVDLEASATEHWGKYRLPRILETKIELPGRTTPLTPIFDFDHTDSQRLIARLSSNDTWMEEQTSPESDEWVQAKLYLLEGERYAMYADDPEDSHLVMDFNEDDPLLRLPVPDIQPGIFLLLRPDGERDYVESLADQLLGEAAPHLRDLQRKWKNLLRAKVHQIGIRATAVQLTSLNCTRASEINIRNWMGPRNIKTRKESDFTAILKFLDVNGDDGGFWESMRTIENAHRRAGMKLRSLLMDQVRNSDLKLLLQTGEASFSIPGASGGKLLAIRVTEVAQQNIRTRQSHLGRIKQMELD